MTETTAKTRTRTGWQTASLVLSMLCFATSVTQAATSQNIFFVPYDAAAVASLDQDFEAFRPITVPAGAYKGMDEDFHGMVVGERVGRTQPPADNQARYYQG